ncbi:hypothetical protein PC129_g13761 [Phytophthora cactorum]|uniref:Uncharacterized protein n=1 Tax=Phytophthora cactorum TaxID=29920 RepID=A0A8T1HSW1_9STRA|nr:hypothetical protein Pcac1_g27840 [Phytophthora cactorum]KAG2806993.1 hypothetical protein PC111_g17128 [Phytophthora cactorum]KAG2822480.1 hypothetical protein PC112_g10935 [Phytophthora cactorum]KAG2851823.1 hypothetical protein PC113_g15580 [Phytophthora cactorum]KAG2891067.1 hypothetical protein PC114_g17154 [Phytophthora cactorum]
MSSSAEAASSMFSTKTVASSPMFSIEAVVLRKSSSANSLSASSYSSTPVSSPSSLGEKAYSSMGPASLFAGLHKTPVFLLWREKRLKRPL